MGHLLQRSHLVLALLVCIAVARVVSTYGIFNATADEPWHLVMGLEPLEYGSYTYELKHPPLGRLLIALGPYLAGARSMRHHDIAKENVNVFYEEGNQILQQNYWRNLTLARLGVLPFLVLAIVVTYLWGARWFSRAAGLWSAGLVSILPPILGHAGVATIDVACAGTTAAALYAFLRWAESPGWKPAVWLGTAISIAFLSKLSSVPFLAASLAAGVLVLYRNLGWRRILKDAAVAGVVVFALHWMAYGFSVERLAAVGGEHPRVDAVLEARPWLRPAWDAVNAIPLPLTEVVRGLHEADFHNRVGHDSYLLGEYRKTGWWYFFPVVLAVKTPIGLLGLLALALYRRASSRPPARLPHIVLLTTLFALAILAVCLTTHINLGVRHILPIYVPLAVLAGNAIATQASRWRLVALGLAGIAAAESVLAHPDYLADFNVFAGSHPERILAESDLDWGQDLHRLSVRLKELGVQQVTVDYFGSDWIHKAGLPPYRFADPRQPASGHVALSVRRHTLDNAKDGSYEWIKGREPLERVGKSIDLFYLTE